MTQRRGYAYRRECAAEREWALMLKERNRVVWLERQGGPASTITHADQLELDVMLKPPDERPY